MAERKRNRKLNSSFNKDNVISADKALLSSDHDYSQCCTEGEDLEMLILD